ncbi:hypothetical protein KEM52_001503 [Ascosphaera acerosa]|nr:hypothetical protein KEM52_001503 [Ascosphaera acerosa]
MSKSKSCSFSSGLVTARAPWATAAAAAPCLGQRHLQPLRPAWKIWNAWLRAAQSPVRAPATQRLHSSASTTPAPAPAPPRGPSPTAPTPSLVHLEVDGKQHAFSALHLRDACQCKWCVDPHSHQKEFDTAELPPGVRAASVKQSEVTGQAEIAWHEDLAQPHGYGNGGTHVSTYTAAQLRALAAPYRAAGDAATDYRHYWNGAIMARKQAWFEYADYMQSQGTLFDFVRALHRYGLAFVRGVPEDPASVNRLANRLGPIRNTFYGETWDVRSVPQAINVAYTNKYLGFHMDLMYMREAPEFQLLHCMKNSFEGGESLFADTFAAAWRLYRARPDLFWHLVDFHVHFGYDNHGNIYDQVRRTIELAPGAEAKRGGDLTIGDISYVNYAPPFQRPFYRYADGDHSRDFNADLAKYNQAIHAFASILNDPAMVFQLKLQPGVCVVFHNRRAVHARTAFSAPTTAQSYAGAAPSEPERWLRGTYVDGDPVASIMKLAKREQPQKWVADTSDPASLPVVEHWTARDGDPVEEGLRRLR